MFPSNSQAASSQRLGGILTIYPDLFWISAFMCAILRTNLEQRVLTSGIIDEPQFDVVGEFSSRYIIWPRQTNSWSSSVTHSRIFREEKRCLCVHRMQLEGSWVIFGPPCNCFSLSSAKCVHFILVGGRFFTTSLVPG